MYYPNPLPRSPYVMHVLKKQHIFNQIDEEINVNIGDFVLSCSIPLFHSNPSVRQIFYTL